MTPPEEQLHVGAALGQIIAAWRDGRHKDCADALVGIYQCIVEIENERDALIHERDSLAQEVDALKEVLRCARRLIDRGSE